MNKSKKQPAKKRAYVKKSAKWTKGDSTRDIEDIQLFEPVRSIVKKDTELQVLVAMCSTIENWSDEQKTRNLTFIFSKYKDYL